MRPNKLRTAVILIGLGIALLLYNMDRLDGWYFADLLNLWPVLLVAMGIEIIARNSKSPTLGYLSPLLLAGAFVYAGYAGGSSGGDGWLSFSWGDEQPRMQTIERTFDIDQPVDEARYYIDLYNGRLHVGGGGDGLGRGEFRTAGKIRTSISETDGRAVVRVRQSGASRDTDADFDFVLAPELPLTLDLKAEDATMDLDLADLTVSTLYLEVDDGDAEVTLGSLFDSLWASLRPGAARVKIRLPLGTGLRIEGLTSAEDLPGADFQWLEVAGGLETGDFQTAPTKATLHFEAPTSRVSVETY